MINIGEKKAAFAAFFIIRFFPKNNYNPNKFLKINNFYAKICIINNYGGRVSCEERDRKTMRSN